jgi:hypothetical protein
MADDSMDVVLIAGSHGDGTVTAIADACIIVFFHVQLTTK